MSQDHKQKAILEAAIKRFAHFGVAKTTMNEIAKDLSISKALLYYYFPDKISLYGAVLEYITASNAPVIETAIESCDSPFDAIETFLELRTEFIIKYHHILEFLKQFTATTIPENLQKIFTELKKRDMNRIIGIMEKGIAADLFKIDSVKGTAELYFEFLEGFRFNFIANQPNIFPGKKEFQMLLRKEKEFSVVFFKGLTLD